MSLFSEQSIHTCRMLLGHIPPERGNEILRLYFAFHGKVEQYEAVKLDTLTEKEILCLTHGVYFHIEFARWCKENMLNKCVSLDRAISAKLIMNNDLSYVCNDVYCIWFPEVASEETYRTLYQMYPHLTCLIARACAVGNYLNLYKETGLFPEQHVLDEARALNHQDFVDYIVSTCKDGIIYECMTDLGSKIVPMTSCNLKLSQKFPVGTNVIHLKEMYCSELEPWSHTGHITVSDFRIKYQYIDPLGTGVIQDTVVQEKLLLVQNSNVF